MGEVAPPNSWNPDDVLLLKNAIEAGASLESLAKGAVRFSRRFTFQELSDLWRSLLYDKDISEVASIQMIEFELSASNDSKSNKLGSKEKELPFHRRQICSLRSHYYSMLKKIRSEPCQFDDFGSFPLSENNNCNEQVEPPPNGNLFRNCALGSQIGLHYQMQDADFSIGQGVVTDVLRNDAAIASETFQIGHMETGAAGPLQDDVNPLENKIPGGVFGKTRTYSHAEDICPMLIDEDVERSCVLKVEGCNTNQISEGNMNCTCSGIHELNSTQTKRLENHDDANVESMIAFNMSSDSPERICMTLEGQNPKSEILDSSDSITLHHLGFSSPLSDLPLWGAVEEASTMPDFEKECKITAPSFQGEVSKNLNSPRCDSVPTPLEGENCDAVRHIEGDFSGTSSNFTNDGTFFIDMDEKELIEKACLDGLNNFLMNSPIESHQDSEKNLIDSKTLANIGGYSAIPDNSGPGETKNEDVQLISGHDAGNNNGDMSLHLLGASSKATFSPEPSKGFVFCPLNTEDPEVPCNDDVFLPEIGSPISLDLVPLSDVAVLSSSRKASVNEAIPSMLSTAKEGQESSPHCISSSSKFGQAAIGQIISVQHPDGVKADLMVSGYIAGASDTSVNVLNPEITATTAAAEEGIPIVTRESIFLDTSLVPHCENPEEGPCCGNISALDVPEDSKLSVEVPSDVPACIASDRELVSPDFGCEDQLQVISSSDQDQKYSDIEDEVPSFSDVEAMILDMELFPYDEESSFYAREVSKYQNMDTRKKIIRLEEGTKSCLLRTVAFRGAFAVFYGHRLKYYLKKPEVLIGRSTEEISVDIDLREEGRANKISRRQAIIQMDEEGSFSFKNLGRFSLLVNGKNLLKGQSCILTSGTLIEIRGMWFIFEVNPDSVRQYLSKKSMDENKDQTLKLYSFKRELS